MKAINCTIATAVVTGVAFDFVQFAGRTVPREPFEIKLKVEI